MLIINSTRSKQFKNISLKILLIKFVCMCVCVCVCREEGVVPFDKYFDQVLDIVQSITVFFRAFIYPILLQEIRTFLMS